MTIPSISALGSTGAASGVGGTGGIAPIQPMTPMTAMGSTDAATPSTGASDFAASLTGAVDNAQALQENANTLAVQAVTGNLDNIADATIAATRAQVTLQLVSTVRSKAVDAFNQIMNMQA